MSPSAEPPQSARTRAFLCLLGSRGPFIGHHLSEYLRRIYGFQVCALADGIHFPLHVAPSQHTQLVHHIDTRPVYRYCTINAITYTTFTISVVCTLLSSTAVAKEFQHNRSASCWQQLEERGKRAQMSRGVWRKIHIKLCQRCTFLQLSTAIVLGGMEYTSTIKRLIALKRRWGRVFPKCRGASRRPRGVWEGGVKLNCHGSSKRTQGAQRCAGRGSFSCQWSI